MELYGADLGKSFSDQISFVRFRLEGDYKAPIPKNKKLVFVESKVLGGI